MAKQRAGRYIIAAGVVAALVLGVVSFVGWVRGRLPDEAYDLDPACTGKIYDNAAPYEGTAPHPMAVFMESETGHLEYEWLNPGETTDSLGESPAAADIQLVACATLASEQLTGETCAFGVSRSVQIPMASATYQVKVYELRTHREVRSVVLHGQDTKCPQVIREGYRPGRFLSEPTFEQWRKALGDLVNHNR